MVAPISDRAPSLTLLVASTQRRGAEVFCADLAAELRRGSWTTELIALSRPPGPAVPAVPLTTKERLRKLDFGALFGLRSHLRSARPQLVLAFGSATLKYAVMARLFLRQRPALAYVSIGEPLYWARTRRQQATYRILLRRVDRVLSVSRKTGAQLQRLGVPAPKLRITPIGVKAALLELVPEPRSEEFHVLFVGSLSAEKDPLAALNAFLQLNAGPRMRILGAGSLEAELRARVRAAGAEERVEFLGSVNTVDPHFAWADVLLLTSRTEGLPAVLLEAAAAGVPVVAYDVGGVSEAITDGISGRLLPHGHDDELVAALSFYAEHPLEARSAGEAGRRDITARFTMEAAARGFDVALADLVLAR